MSSTMYESFPTAFRDGEQAILTQAISAAVDEVVSAQRIWFSEYEINLVDPTTIAPDLLDYVATLPFSPWRTLWDPDREEWQKRSLLARSNEIFKQRYTPQVLDILFQCLGLDANVKYLSGWILGGVGVGTPLGNDCILGLGLTSYRIETASYIKPGTIEYGLIQWGLRGFGLPIQVQIVSR